MDLNVTSQTEQQGDDRVTTVTVSNPGKAVAFAVHLKVKNGTAGDEILPVLWQDNYFALLPGEGRQVTATYPSAARATPVVEVDGWNVRSKLASQP